MENKEIKKTVLVELDDDALDNVSGGGNLNEPIPDIPTILFKNHSGLCPRCGNPLTANYLCNVCHVFIPINPSENVAYREHPFADE